MTATITQRLLVTEPSSLFSAQSPFLSHFDTVKPLLNRVQSDALCRTQSEASILKVYSLNRYAARVPKADHPMSGKTFPLSENFGKGHIRQWLTLILRPREVSDISSFF